MFLFIVNILLAGSSLAYCHTERNVFHVYINSSDEILAEGQPIKIGDLKEKIKLFISNPQNNDDKAVKVIKDIKYIGSIQVSKGVVSIQCQRNTSYGFYVKVQDQIEKAFDELRNELALDKFQNAYKSLKREYQEAINNCIPKRISEAEPNYIWRDGVLIKNY
jgi:biopolymer transport protein ExbD